MDAAEARPALTAEPGDQAPYLRERILEALGRLSEELRMVVVLYDVEGYTHAEIGQRLSIPAGTSKSRLNAARRMLRERLRSLTEAE